MVILCDNPVSFKRHDYLKNWAQNSLKTVFKIANKKM